MKLTGNFDAQSAGQGDQPLISLSNAGVERDGHWLVRGVDLTVSAGEIVTMVGPNGSGKSTSAKMMLGILAPDEGDVVRKPDIRVAYVPQKLEIDWTLPLTVSRFMRLKSGMAASASKQTLERTGVGDLEDAQMRNLSGGEFQRVMLARAILRKPDFLVLDEPVQGVDFSGQIALYELISALRDELGCGVLMISHDLHIVMAQTDRVICLNGHVCCQGTPGVVAEDPAYKKLFGRKAAEALAVYTHEHDHTHLPDGSVLNADGSISASCQPLGGPQADDSKGHDHA